MRASYKYIAVFFAIGAMALFFLFAQKNNETTERNNDVAAIPSRTLDESIDRAREFYENEYLKRSLMAVERKSVTVLFSADGTTAEVPADHVPALGERTETFDAYVEYQLYTVVHFLMYFRDWGYAETDPLVVRGKEWLISTFNEKEGGWVWSEQGCLHAKAVIALVRLGEKEKARKAMDWALHSRLWTGAGFTELQTDDVIHSVTRSALGKHSQEAGESTNKRMFNREGTAKFLYAMAALGMSDTPEFQKAKERLERSYSENTSVDAVLKSFGEVAGVSWVIYLYEENGIAKDGLYEKAKTIVRALAKKDEEEKMLMNYERGKVLAAIALMEGEVNESGYAMTQTALTLQLPDGSWEPNGSRNNNKPDDWDASKVYDEGFLLNYKGGIGSTTKTMLEALIVFRNGIKNASEEKKFFSEAEKDRIDASVDKAVNFLIQNQLPSGGFLMRCDGNRDGQNSPCKESGNFFFTAQVLIALNDISERQDLAALKQKAVGFISKLEENGLWRFNGFLPPDTDDTSVASLSLKVNGHAFSPNIDRLISSRDQNGLFKTWIPEGESGLDDSFTNEDVDCVINANILAYLAKMNFNDKEVIKPVCDYLQENIKNELSCSIYYPSRSFLFYTISRATHNGASCFLNNKKSIIQETLDWFDYESGGFGGVTESAFAINTLLEFGYHGDEVKRGIHYLVENQNQDGSFDGANLFHGAKKNDKVFFRSSAFNTAVAIETLAKYRYGMGK